MADSSIWYSCKFCRKVYPDKHLLSIHKRREHLKQIRNNVERQQTKNSKDRKRIEKMTKEKSTDFNGTELNTVNNFFTSNFNEKTTEAKFNCNAASVQGEIVIEICSAERNLENFSENTTLSESDKNFETQNDTTEPELPSTDILYQIMTSTLDKTKEVTVDEDPSKKLTPILTSQAANGVPVTEKIILIDLTEDEDVLKPSKSSSSGHPPTNPTQKCLDKNLFFHFKLKPTKTKPKPSCSCPICDEVITSRIAYRKHMRAHGRAGQKPFKCSHCEKCYLTQYWLMRHEISHLTQSTLESPPIIQIGSEVNENLHKNYESKSSWPSICMVPNEDFVEMEDEPDEIDPTISTPLHRCNKCSRNFFCSNKLAIHTKICHRGQSDVTDFPSGENRPGVIVDGRRQADLVGLDSNDQNMSSLTLTFVDNSEEAQCHNFGQPLSMGVNQDFWVDGLICEVCGMTLQSPESRSSHKKMHSTQRPYSCPVCLRRFCKKKFVEIHHQKKHSQIIEEPTYFLVSSDDLECISN